MFYSQKINFHVFVTFILISVKYTEMKSDMESNPIQNMLELLNQIKPSLCYSQKVVLI